MRTGVRAGVIGYALMSATARGAAAAPVVGEDGMDGSLG